MPGAVDLRTERQRAHSIPRSDAPSTEIDEDEYCAHESVDLGVRCGMEGAKSGSWSCRREGGVCERENISWLWGGVGRRPGAEEGSVEARRGTTPRGSGTAGKGSSGTGVLYWLRESKSESLAARETRAVAHPSDS